MSDDGRTHFKFERDGIRIELTGDRRFVEQMYRRIMRDIEAVRPEPIPDDSDAGPAPDDEERSETNAETSADSRAESEVSDGGAPDPEDSPDRPQADHVVWVMRVTNMMRRIYMADIRDFARSPLIKTLRPENVTTLYIDKPSMKKLLGDVERRRDTLWAELTESGRQRISEPDS